MDREDETKRVAVACQGGGSHTAFTAGVLKTILKYKKERYEIAALSGTSGGAICALLAWYGLLVNDEDRAAKLLDSFWEDISADSLWDTSVNNLTVGINQLQGDVVLPQASPYFYPTLWQDRLRRTLEKHFPFEMLEELVKPSSPTLLVSAVDVLSGQFKVFRSHRFRDGRKTVNRRDDGISVDAILASAALPTLVRAVHVGTGVYWDGLFSQNPPIKDFIEGIPDVGEKPDEIWVVQINPERRSEEPTSMVEILDRRNELAGNLSLRQEIFFVETINKLIKKNRLAGNKYKLVKVRPPIEVGREEIGGQPLDYASKLNRDPSFLEAMMAYGENQAKDFLEGLP